MPQPQPQPQQQQQQQPPQQHQPQPQPQQQPHRVAPQQLQLPVVPKFVLKPSKLQQSQPQQQRDQFDQQRRQQQQSAGAADSQGTGNRPSRGAGIGAPNPQPSSSRELGTSTKPESTSRSGSPRFHPYASADAQRRSQPGTAQKGDSQILHRLSSPVHDRSSTLVPGLPDTVPIPPIRVPPKSDSLLEPDPSRIIRTDLPLGQQGWTSNSSSASSGSISPTGTDPSGDFRTDPTAPEETSSSEKGDPPRPAARGSRKLHPDPAYENLEFATGAGYTGGAKPKKAVVQQPKSILKTPDTGTKKKTVQYTPSTKRGRSVSTKRPPTPDLEVSIRPTSTWDIVDEVLAGQPTKTKAGKTVPDTLIQISEPTPHDQAKKPKKVLTRSDRILRSKK